MKNSQYPAQVDIGREHDLFLAKEVTIMKTREGFLRKNIVAV